MRRYAMKREIIIDGTASDWFEKATFILKDDSKIQTPNNLVNYAEELIENHMKKCPQSNPVNKIPSLSPVDFTHKQINPYQKAQKAYQAQIQMEYSRLQKEKEAIKKRARHVNTFVTLSLIACILSLLALAFSSLG